jgi:hypothetical protein
MHIILSSKVRDHIKRLGIFLIAVILIAGIGSCDGGASCGGLAQWYLGTSSSEGGQVIVSGGPTFAHGTVVTIEAVADECYEFVNWTGANVSDPYSSITTITMDEARNVTANFALLSYDLIVDSTDGGHVTSPGEDAFTYDCGTVVPLVAVAEEGYYFVSWSGDVDTIANIHAPTTTITMKGDYSVTANFEQIPPGQFALTTSSTVGGLVKTPGEGTFLYDEGTVVDLVAEADECYEFVNWTGDTVADPNSAATNITMDGAKNVTANFALLSYSLTIDSTDGGEVTSPGEGTFTYDCGTVVDLVAEAEPGYHFVEWTGDTGTIAHVDAAETTITVNGAYNITANFALFSGGNGTAEDPYQIGDWWQLDNVRNYLSSHFVVINDLDSNSIGYTELASATAHDGKGWQPIGVNNDTFVGSFDGQGYEVCDLFINRPDESEVGLFGAVGEGGVIGNVGVNGNVTGYDNAGGVVGKNEGTISNSYANCRAIGNYNVGGLVGKNDNSEGTVTNSYATGNVTGADNVGGLVGWNREGRMSNSYATGRVTGDNNVGGLVGKNSDTAGNSYATGRVTGSDNVGGLVGRNDNTGNVTNSYSTGSVTGSTHVGGLMGRNYGTVSNSFWDTQTSGKGSSAGGTGKTSAQMMDIDTFSGAGWDITTVANSSTRNTDYVWNIVDDVTYAFLSWQPV